MPRVIQFEEMARLENSIAEIESNVQDPSYDFKLKTLAIKVLDKKRQQLEQMRIEISQHKPPIAVEYVPVPLAVSFDEFVEQANFCDRYPEKFLRDYSTPEAMWQHADRYERAYALKRLDTGTQYTIFARMLGMWHERFMHHLLEAHFQFGVGNLANYWYQIDILLKYAHENWGWDAWQCRAITPMVGALKKNKHVLVPNWDELCQRRYWVDELPFPVEFRSEINSDTIE
jgi:hypothetical protein